MAVGGIDAPVITPSLVVNLSTTTANDDGSGVYFSYYGEWRSVASGKTNNAVFYTLPFLAYSASDRYSVQRFILQNNKSSA